MDLEIKARSRLFNFWISLTVIMFMMVGNMPGVQANDNAKIIAPIISLLLSDEPTDIPMYWNEERINEGETFSVVTGDINELTVEIETITSIANVDSTTVEVDTSTDCYALQSSSLNPFQRVWSIVATGVGSCNIAVTVIGIQSSVSSLFKLQIGEADDSNTIYSLIADAQINNQGALIDGTFNLTNLIKWTPDAGLNTHPGAVFSDTNVPNMYEFDATHKGVPLKGVMLTTARKADSRNFNSLDFDARTAVRFVNGVPALVGSGKVVGSAGNTNTFAYIATGADLTLEGPLVGREFHVGGINKLNALCVQDRLVGFSVFDNARTLSKISTSMVGFTNKDCAANNNRFIGETGVYADFQSVDTHIGTILRGRGTAHPLDNGKISTVQDMDENSPDYAMYFLGLAEGLSDAHEIMPLDSDAELNDNVYIFDPFAIAKIAKIRRQAGTMIFSEPPEILAGIAVGDIIVGKPTSRLRDGFIREVTAKGQQNGKFFLQSKPARLDQVFKLNGFTLENRPLYLADLDEVVIPEYTSGNQGSRVALGFEKSRMAYQTSRQELEMQATEALSNNSSSAKRKAPKVLNLPLPSLDFDHVFVDDDEDLNTKNDQWRTEGLFELGASITVQFRMEGCGFLCTRPYFLLKFNFEEDFELAGKVFTDEPGSINALQTIATQKFGRIWLGPVSIRPQVDINLILQGETDTDIQWGVDQYFTSELGIELEDGDWDTINQQTFGIAASPTPNYEPKSGEADMRARVALEGSVKVSGIKVGGVDAGIYTDVEAKTPRDPLWEVTAGLNSEAYIEIDLLLTTINGGPFELFDIPFNIDDGEAPNLDPTIDSIKVAGVPIEDGKAVKGDEPGDDILLSDIFAASEDDPLKVTVAAFDPETGSACCNVTLTSDLDGQLGSLQAGDVSNRGNYRFDLTELSVGLHTMEVAVTPTGEGASSTVIEEFTLHSLGESLGIDPFACNELQLAFAGDNSVSKTVTEPDTVTLKARLGGPCPVLAGYEVEFHENEDGRQSVNPFATQQTYVENDKNIAIFVIQANEASLNAREFVVKFRNRSGDLLESNIVTLRTSSPIEVPEIDGFPGGSGGFWPSGAGAFGQSRLVASTTPSQSMMSSIDMPGNTEPHRLGLENWGVGETAYFRNPFPSNANFDVTWEMTDSNAVISQNAGGDAQITPSTPGWHRVTALFTYNQVGYDRQYRTSKMFYVSSHTNEKWRGYDQVTPTENATNLPLLIGDSGVVN